jgi:peptidoglycan/LPS O-acetylase OafA/YrhL
MVSHPAKFSGEPLPLPQNPKSTTVPRNSGIDLLRGLSIVLVILNHVGLRIRLARGVLAAFLPRQFLIALNFNGSEAVLIFFVISGFLIATNSIGRWGRLGAIDARAFYVRRAARILPCLVALVVLLSVLHLARVPDYVINQPHQSLPGAISSAFGLYLNWYEAHNGYLPASWDVLWSLSIEEIFYLAFPIVCLLLRNDWILAPILALLALSLPVTHGAIVGNPIWSEKAYLPGIAGIATGVLGALIAAHWKPKRRGVLVLLVVIGVSGMIAVLGFEGPLWPYLGEYTMLLLTFPVMGLLLAFHCRPQWKLPGTVWLQSFGRLSYEIYLTHMFVVMTLVRAFKTSGASLWWGVMWYPPALGLAWALGGIVAKCFSTPAEQAIRRRLMPIASRRAQSQ